ncbi:MAG: haloacid dehalogenase type II [Terriglobales bacterium]
MKLCTQALVFDAYGTLFDVHTVIALCDRKFPGQGAELSKLWRTKQLEYTWLRSLVGRYEDFWSVTESALTFACRSLSLECSPETRQELMESYLHLETFPEVQATLSKLSQYKLAILSNGSPKMLAAAVKHAGLRGIFSDVISADEVKIYKSSWFRSIWACLTVRLRLYRRISGISPGPKALGSGRAGSTGGVFLKMNWVSRQMPLWTIWIG